MPGGPNDSEDTVEGAKEVDEKAAVTNETPVTKIDTQTQKKSRIKTVINKVGY